ncbi:MAG: dipeptide/oligopeptide/nickel ABC transporter ATP-binding protein [Methanosarcina sp.]|jgi:ABC-type oligopeptide transport system ATPase subunit|nr:dipeptide/oligopeptide/nickel ABC transporter ATP-binding protein [Methanosarcina sp.]MDD3873350.1 dipeptide/oligopeptide/nickel ABC transporter ATP-binding protein [Methanosarcina sp.]MDD4523329.1 dipeptide/oligopeptide/nickel ABC transporter ATP-binding protein [Methanosarcina sp.]HHV24058.1 ABC transporter ATP-binding protein [Methanosarcina sp.]
MSLIKVKNLCKYYSSGIINQELTKAVDDVSFEIKRNEIVGLMGSSGSGKTTVGRLILRYIKPTSGQIIFDGQDITKLNSTNLRPFRPRMQMIFQNPEASIDPRMSIENFIAEPLRVVKKIDESEVHERVSQLLEDVGLTEDIRKRRACQVSGGQNQRAVIARILASNPEFIVSDEATSNLDVSAQAQIIQLLKKIHEEYNLAILFISHDRELVDIVCDRWFEMERGKIKLRAAISP